MKTENRMDRSPADDVVMETCTVVNGNWRFSILKLKNVINLKPQAIFFKFYLVNIRIKQYTTSLKYKNELILHSIICFNKNFKLLVLCYKFTLLH